MYVCLLTLLLLAPPQVLPPDPARDAWQALQAGDGEKAAAAFKTVLASNPNDVRSLTGAAVASHMIGRDDQAMSYLKRALQVDPDSTDANSIIAQVAYAQGDLD